MSPYYIITADTTLTTRSGTITIPIVVDGISFEKTFSWTLSLQGERGATGETGPTGETGMTGAAGPEAVVTITPININ